MSEQDFPPLGSQDSPLAARQLNPECQESYSTALRKSPPVVPPSIPFGSNLDNPANLYLPPPAGRRTKINKDRNEYWVIERVEREWYSHDPDLDGSDLYEEIELWGDGEGEVLKKDAQLDTLSVTTEVGGVRAAMLWGIADNFRKCNNIKLDLPTTNLRNIPWVEEPWMSRLSSGSPKEHRGVAPKSIAAETPKSNSMMWLVNDESSEGVGAVEFLEGLDEDNHHPDERTLEPRQVNRRPDPHEKWSAAGAARTSNEYQGTSGGTAKSLSGSPIDANKLMKGALVSNKTNEIQGMA
jgi:hypothetical protein